MISAATVSTIVYTLLLDELFVCAISYLLLLLHYYITCFLIQILFVSSLTSTFCYWITRKIRKLTKWTYHVISSGFQVYQVKPQMTESLEHAFNSPSFWLQYSVFGVADCKLAFRNSFTFARELPSNNISRKRIFE